MWYGNYRCTTSGWTIIAVINLLIQLAHGVTCPPDVISAMFSCYRYVMKNNNDDELLIAGGDVVLIKNKCRDGSFQKTVDCVQNLFYMCRRSSKMSKLEELMSPSRMEWAFSMLCNNIELYADRAHCLRRENLPISTCLAAEKRTYKYMLSVVNKHKLFDTICNFMVGMTGCIDRPVRHKCGHPIADLAVEFMRGITPPTCVQYEVIHSKAPHRTSNANHLTLWITWVVCLVLFQL